MKSKTSSDVTNNASLKHASQLLETSIAMSTNANQYNKLIESLPIAIYTCNKDGQIESYNKAAVNLWGREPVVGKDLWCGSFKIFDAAAKQLSPEESPMALTIKEGIALTGKEIIIERPNGERRNVLPNPQPLFDTEGNISGAIFTLLDITEVKRSEEEIKKNEEKLRVAIDAASLGTFNINLLTDEIEYSERYLEIYGFDVNDRPTREEVINKLHPDDKVVRIHCFNEALLNGILEYEARVVNNEENERWIRVKGKIIFENDQPARALGTVMDITKEKNTLTLIEENEIRLRLAIEGTELATFDLDIRTLNVIYSPRLGEILGVDYPQKITYVDLHNKIHPDDRQLAIDAFDAAMHTGNCNYEARAINPDKKELWIKIKANVIFTNNKVPLRMIGTVADITERKINEDKLAKLAAIVESSEDAIIGKKLDGTITSWNNAAERIFGYSAEEMIGSTIFKLIPETHIDEEKSIIEKLKIGDRVKHFETKRLTKNKTLLDVSLSVSPTKDKEGKITGASKIARDITSQKRIERLIRENEYRLNIAVEAAEMGTWELNLVTDEVIYSKRYLEILGLDPTKHYSHDEIITVIHPDDMEMRTKLLKEALKTGTLDIEMRLLTGPEKKITWIKSRAKVFYDENNKPLKMMGTTLDITRQKTVFETLRQSEEKFRLLANSMPQLVWTGDPQGNLNYFNQSVYNYSGLTKEVIDNDGWLQIVHPEDREENINKWMHAVSTGTDFLFEHRFRKHNGEYRWQLSRAIPQKDNNGKIKMWVGTSTDINEIKESEQQKDLFISMASHELKTPITSIKGYIQILLSMHSNSQDEFLKNSLVTVNKQIEILTNLIGDLLDLSKIKSGNLQLNKEIFSINDMINEVLIDMKHTEPAHNFLFNPEKECTIYADKERIGQVLINFLTNAIKYAPNSNTINIRSTVKNNYAKISVEDKGIGINKIDQSKIFDRFYRVEGKDERTFPGFGIGLFIASEIINRHDGKIEVESEPGKGSIFSFFLPLENNSNI